MCAGGDQCEEGSIVLEAWLLQEVTGEGLVRKTYVEVKLQRKNGVEKSLGSSS